jgi:hypothetical protein
MVLRTAQLRDSQGHSSRGERAIFLTIEVVRRNRDGKENALRHYRECGGMRDGPDYAVIQAAMEIAAETSPCGGRGAAPDREKVRGLMKCAYLLGG